MMLYSTPRVPPELSDHIIDYLRDDIHALSSCSLTCRTWLPRTRHCRFKSVRVDFHSATVFGELLNLNPAIRYYVRELGIWKKLKPSHATLRGPREYERLKANLQVILAKLPAVVKLELNALTIDARFGAALAHNMPRLRELRLVRCNLHSISELILLCRAFPALKRFKLGDTSLMATDTNTYDTVLTGPRSSPRPRITSLRFPSRIAGDTVLPAIIEWILSERLYGELRTLEVPDLREDDIPIIQALLDRLGPTLEYLYISLLTPTRLNTEPSDPNTYPSPPTSLSLTPCTHLRELGLWPLTLKNQTPSSRHFAWATHLLSTLTSTHLQHVHLRVHAGAASVDDLDAPGWAGITQTLSRSDAPFRCLRSITLKILTGESATQDILLFIRREMALLESKVAIRYVHQLC